MKESSLKTAKTFVRLVTALSFVIYTAYQIFLVVQVSAQRTGRLIGVTFYVIITVASILALIYRPGIRIVRSVMFVVGFMLLFIMRMLSALSMFDYLDFSRMYTVLTVASYVATELGTLLLAIYYLAVRTRKNVKHERTITMIMMSIVILLFTFVLAAECVLVLQYHLNVDYNIPLTLMGKVLFYIGFVGTAVNFMMPPDRGDDDLEEYINKEQADADVMVMSPQTDRVRRQQEKTRNPMFEEGSVDMVMFSEDDRPRRDKDKKRERKTISDMDMVMSPQTDRSIREQDKKRNPVLDDSTIVFSDSDNPRSHKRRR